MKTKNILVIGLILVMIMGFSSTSLESINMIQRRGVDGCNYTIVITSPAATSMVLSPIQSSEKCKCK